MAREDTTEPGSTPVEEKTDDLLALSVSEGYFELRPALDLTVDATPRAWPAPAIPDKAEGGAASSTSTVIAVSIGVVLLIAALLALMTC